MGYEESRKQARGEYRKTDNGKNIRREAEKRRRLRIPSSKKKGSEGIKKKTQQLSAKQNKPATTTINKITRIKASKHGKKKSIRSSKGACHLCGAQGVIVKKISWKFGEEYPYFSFKIKKRKKADKKNGRDEKNNERGLRYYWQME